MNTAAELFSDDLIRILLDRLRVVAGPGQDSSEILVQLHDPTTGFMSRGTYVRVDVLATDGPKKHFVSLSFVNP